MSWNFSFTALSKASVVERLDRERVSQGGNVPDKVVDAMGTMAESIDGAPPALRVESHGHFDETNGGDVHFVVRPSGVPEVVG